MEKEIPQPKATKSSRERMSIDLEQRRDYFKDSPNDINHPIRDDDEVVSINEDLPSPVNPVVKSRPDENQAQIQQANTSKTLSRQARPKRAWASIVDGNSY
jgi:hypothetical protein